MGASDFRLKEYSYNDLPAGVTTDYDLKHFSIAYDEEYIIPALKEIRAINRMSASWPAPGARRRG
jgi:glucosylceramidase